MYPSPANFFNDYYYGREENPISIHSGHRERLKNRYLQHGLDSFEEHEALELLLFYALPRRDTNALAHTLLERFGSLENLFRADAADIALVEGVGTHSAILIKLAADIYRRSRQDSLRRKTKLTSIDAAIRYAQSLLEEQTEEQFYVICLDAHCTVKNAERISRGTATEAPVYIRHITESVIRTGAAKVMIAHNHPGGSALPSEGDSQVTKSVLEAMNALSIEFLDHIIIGQDDAFSFAEKILLRHGCDQKDARLSQYAGRVMQDFPASIFPKR